MSVPYYADYPYQITTWRHYLGVAIPNQNNPDLLYTWFSFDNDQKDKNFFWPIAQWSFSPTLKYNIFDASIKNFSYNPTFGVLTSSIDYYNQWEEFNWYTRKVMDHTFYIITKVYFNNDLVFDYDQFIAQNHAGWPIFPFESKSYDIPPYQIDLNNEDLEIAIYMAANQTPYQEVEYLKINNDREQYHYIDFDDGLEQKIILPIGKTIGEKRYETFTFTKLFPNDFDSPEQINDILEVEYYDPVNGLNPKLTKQPQVMINYNNGYNDVYEVGTTWEKEGLNNYILSVDDQFYYNEHQKKVYQGTSNKYITENNLIIPWDYANNTGEIKITLQLQTYDQQTFFLTLPIKNKNKLSGNQDAKYYFTYKEIKNDDLDFDYSFNFNLGRYLEYVNKQI